MKLLHVVLLCIAPLLMGAEYYQYTDENGVVTFSQQAPRDREANRVKLNEGGPSQVVTAPEPAATPAEPEQPELTPEQQAMMEKLQAAEAARQAEIARIRESNCKRARALLENLQRNARIRVRDDSGEEHVMPETERQERIERAQRGIVENCRAESQPSGQVANAP